MVIIQIFCVKSFTAHFTIESIYPSMFRLMILLPLSTPENLAAELAGKSTALVASHVQLVVVAVVVALPTNAAEMGILPSVMLGVLFKTTFRCECLVAFLAFLTFNSMHKSFLVTTDRTFVTDLDSGLLAYLSGKKTQFQYKAAFQ